MSALTEMASSIPPTEFLSHASSSATIPDISMPPPTIAGMDVTTMNTTMTTGRSSASVLAAVIIGIVIVIMSLFAVSQGAPGFFVLFGFLGAFVAIASAMANQRSETRLAEEKAAAEFEAEMRLKNEIAQTVKETI